MEGIFSVQNKGYCLKLERRKQKESQLAIFFISVFILCLKYLIIQMVTKRSKVFLIGIHSMQEWTSPTRHGVTRKRRTKKLRHTGNLFRNNLQLKDVCWL